MKKIMAFAIILLMILGSFGAIGANITNNKKTECNCNSDGNKTTSDDINILKSRIAEEGLTFTVAENEATQYSIDSLCKLVEPDNWQSEAPWDYDLSGVGLPAKYDWRDNGGVTSVKNQGSCGSCWAFGTCAPLESAIKIKDKINVDLSEQWLVSCNTGGYDCDGGWWAHDWHAGKAGKCGGTGAVYESDFSYTATNGHCSGPYDHQYLIDDWAYVGGSSGVASTSKIKQAIKTYGPVSAAVAVDNSGFFHNYDSGVYNFDYGGRVNHAITLVGWDDSQGSNGVWFLKNSWGTSWGENGYMKIEYGCSSVGYAACYIDGYEKISGDEIKVQVNINEITNDPGRGNFDEIDTILDISRGGIKPEWYYRVGVDSEYHVYENKISQVDPDHPGFWIWDWKSVHTWKPQQGYIFEVDNKEVEVTFKLMDDDVVSADDLADVSSYSGGGADDSTSDKRGAIYHGTYNLATGDLTGDTTGKDGSYLTTKGGGSNNAKVWFTITDTYDEEEYEPDLGVDPSPLNFGSVSKDTHTKTLNIKNEAKSDPKNWAEKLTWTATDDKSWIRLSPTSGSVSGGGSDPITVTVDTTDMSYGSSTSGKITVNSNDGSKTVTVSVSVKERSRSTSREIIYSALQNLRLQFPQIFSLLYKINFFNTIIQNS